MIPCLFVAMFSLFCARLSRQLAPRVPDLRALVLLVATFFTRAASAQLNAVQYDGLWQFFDAANCTARDCPRFGREARCVSAAFGQLVCVGGDVVGM